MVSEHNDYVGLTTTSKTKLAGYLAAAFSQVRAAQCSVCVAPGAPGAEIPNKSMSFHCLLSGNSFQCGFLGIWMGAPAYASTGT